MSATRIATWNSTGASAGMASISASAPLATSLRTIGRGKMPIPPPAFAMSILVRALLQRLSDFCAIRDAAIASRIRPWIGEWLASDQTGSVASPPAKAEATAGLASHTSSTAPIGLVFNAGCAIGPAAKAMSVRPVSSCWIRFAVRSISISRPTPGISAFNPATKAGRQLAAAISPAPIRTTPLASP